MYTGMCTRMCIHPVHCVAPCAGEHVGVSSRAGVCLDTCCHGVCTVCVCVLPGCVNSPEDPTPHISILREWLFAASAVRPNEAPCVFSVAPAALGCVLGQTSAPFLLPGSQHFLEGG